MSDRGLHRISDDLCETWLEDWIGAGIHEIEEYLAKHAAFLAFLESRDGPRVSANARADRPVISDGRASEARTS